MDEWNGNLWIFPKQNEKQTGEVFLLRCERLHLLRTFDIAWSHGWPSLLCHNSKDVFMVAVVKGLKKVGVCGCYVGLARNN